MSVAFLMLLGVVAAPNQAPIIVLAPDRAFPNSRRVSEPELAAMRGGLRLPNGLDVALGIDIQTRVDGLLALHTIYASEGPNPGIRVFTDGAKPVPTAPATTSVTTNSTAGAPLLIVDRSPTGTTIVPTAATTGATVNLVNGDPSTWLTGEGQTQVPVVANGPAIDAAPGRIGLTADVRGAVVTLQAAGLEVQQLVGQASGVIIANTANDRVINTVSSINVDVQGLTPALMASTFAAQRAALDTIITR